MVRLTVTHDEFEAGSEMPGGITEGWPRVLSILKSLLETGRPLRTWAGMSAWRCKALAPRGGSGDSLRRHEVGSDLPGISVDARGNKGLPAPV